MNNEEFILKLIEEKERAARQGEKARSIVRKDIHSAPVREVERAAFFAGREFLCIELIQWLEERKEHEPS